MSQIENERKMPSAEALALFAKKLGVTPAELTHGSASASEPEAISRLQEGWRALYGGAFGEAEKAFRAAARAAKRGNHFVLHADAIAGLALCSERRGLNADAMRLYEQALGLFEEHAAAPAAVEAVAGIARCHQMAGRTRLALHVLETYLLKLHVQELEDPRALMRTYAALLWPYEQLGLFEEAGKAAEYALRLQSRVEAPEHVARMHLNVAGALFNLGRTDDALASLRKAEEIFRDLNWRTEIARAQTNRGVGLMNRGDLDGARRALEAAAETFQAVGFTLSEARNLNELARLERLSGRPARAEAQARRALELLEEMEVIPELALAHRELGLCLLDENRNRAEVHLRQATELYERCGEVDHAADTHRLLGDLLEREEPHSGTAEYRAGLLLIAGRLGRVD